MINKSFWISLKLPKQVNLGNHLGFFHPFTLAKPRLFFYIYPPKILIMSELYDNRFFEDLRRREFSRLDENHHVYLDYTGGNLHPKSLVEQHCKSLNEYIFGNPHSGNPSSMLSTQLIEAARQKILDYFKAEDYFCVFTANASGSLKIIGEGYPFDEKSTFILLADNHNSVNGIREFCSKKGGVVKYIPVDVKDLTIHDDYLRDQLSQADKMANNLFAFPAQSNVSGVKHDLKWIAEAQSLGFDVMLDAAAFVPSNALDLSLYKPNFVSLSFYKIFGFPTGIGALLIRKDTFDKIQKPWFAGGTVSYVSVGIQEHYLQPNHERFEDGTINYLHIPVIKQGLEFIESVGINRITNRVKSLSHYLFNELSTLKHDNGKPLVHLFGTNNFEIRGGTIILNFFDKNGDVISFQAIEKLANRKQISIRTGCFCNPGLDEINHCVTKEESALYHTKKDMTYTEMVYLIGRMRGAVRVSVGIATNQNDLDEFIAFSKSITNLTVHEIVHQCEEI